MSEFWLTRQTMEAVRGEGYRAFHLFGGTHLAELGVCLLLCVTGSLLYRRMDEKARRSALIAITVLLLADELLKDVGSLATGQFEWQFLPFHLCSINIFVCLWYTLRPNKLCAEFLYALCLPGAAVALLMPTWTALPVWNFMHLHSTSVHMMLLLYPCLLLAGGFRPDYRRLPKVFACLCAACVPALILNAVLGTNFMFLNGTDANPLLELLERFLGKAYVLGIVPILCAVWFVMYLPWVSGARRYDKKTTYIR